MQKDIIQKIDLLVEMSDTNNQYDALKEEFSILELDIAKTKKKIEEIKESITDSKYIKASDRLIDENIKISLENKLQSYQDELSQIDVKIQDISLEEEECHQNILVFEKEILSSKKFLESLELKIKTIGGKDKTVYSFYEDLIDTTEKEISKSEKRLHEARESFSLVQERLSNLASSRVSLEEKIRKNTLQLDEVKDALLNSNTYVDAKLKRADENKILELQVSLDDAEKRRLEIITDPSFIGHDATELLLDDDRTSTLLKIRELVTLVKTRPYMDVSNDEIEDILSDALNKRDEFASSIEVKQYDGIDSTVIDGRISFLESCRDKILIEKSSLEQKIREYDTVSVKEIMRYIVEAKELRDRLKEDIDEYKNVMNENIDYKTPKKKASLSSAFHRKCDELQQVNLIVESYEHDLEDIVLKSKILEEQDLLHLNVELKSIEEEIRVLQKKKVLQNSPIDILAMERDKSALKLLSDDVEMILHRKKYSKTPDEILDEIEISLSSYGDEEETLIDDDSNVSIDYRIDTDEEENESLVEHEGELSHVQNSEDEDNELEEESLDFVDSDPVISLEEILSDESDTEKTAKIDDIKEEENRFRVIRVTPIDEEDHLDKTYSQDKEDEFMVNDFEDTDYISFNDLIEGGLTDED